MDLCKPQKSRHMRQPSNLALTIRISCDPQQNFSARVVRGGLLLRRDRFTQWKNLRHDWLDLSGVDQRRDLCEVSSIRVNGDGRSMNGVFLELDTIGERNQRHDDPAHLN